MRNGAWGIAALALMFASSSLSAAVIDQSFLAPETGGARIGGASVSDTSGAAQAQTFTAGLSGTFHSATLMLRTFSSTTTDVEVGLYSVDGLGAPLIELGSVMLNTASLASGISTLVTYDFSSQGIAMTAGTQYALVALHGPGFGTSWRADVPGAGYAGGQRWVATYDSVADSLTSAWTGSPTWDFLFETRVSATVTAPATAVLLLPLLLVACRSRR